MSGRESEGWAGGWAGRRVFAGGFGAFVCVGGGYVGGVGDQVGGWTTGFEMGG